MLNLNKIRESRKIPHISNRRPLSDIISESYELLYNCENPKVRTLIEAHIKDIEANPRERTALADNLHALQKLVENEGISDPRVKVDGPTDLDIDTEVKEVVDIEVAEPEAHETQTRDEKTETAVEVSTTAVVTEGVRPSADRDQFKRFSENSRGKVFQKNLRKSSDLKESFKSFDLKESLSLYKAANSLMTQMAIELEHNTSFMETYKVCSTVLGTTLQKLRESIINSQVIPAKVIESLSKFSTALREDDEIDDFINWVDSEYPAEEAALEDPEGIEDDGVEGEEGAEGGCPVEAVIDGIANEEIPAEAVADIVDEVVPDEVADEEAPIEEQVPELTEEEEKDLRKYLCILRGCEETEDMEEPTEEELDAMEERLNLRRAHECGAPKMIRSCSKKKEECSDA